MNAKHIKSHILWLFDRLDWAFWLINYSRMGQNLDFLWQRYTDKWRSDTTEGLRTWILIRILCPIRYQFPFKYPVSWSQHEELLPGSIDITPFIIQLIGSFVLICHTNKNTHKRSAAVVSSWAGTLGLTSHIRSVDLQWNKYTANWLLDTVYSMKCSARLRRIKDDFLHSVIT